MKNTSSFIIMMRIPKRVKKILKKKKIEVKIAKFWENKKSSNHAFRHPLEGPLDGNWKKNRTIPFIQYQGAQKVHSYDSFFLFWGKSGWWFVNPKNFI